MGRHRKNSIITTNSSDTLEQSTTIDIISSIRHRNNQHTNETLHNLEILEEVENGTLNNNNLQLEIETEIEIPNEHTMDNEPRKKRGRKPKERFFYNDPLKFGKYAEDEESIIVKLPISCANIEPEPILSTDGITTYNPDILDPIPFDPFTFNEKEINDAKSKSITSTMMLMTPYTDTIKSSLSNDNSTTFENTQTNKLLDNTRILGFETIISNNPEPKMTNKDFDNMKYDYQTLLKKESIKADVNKFINFSTTGIVSPTALTDVSSSSTSTTVTNKEVRQIDIILQNKSQKEQRLELLVKFANNIFANNSPSNTITRTDIACFWCCHQFECHPWGIPTKIENAKFHLFGVFCSPNCAASYLFNVFNKDNLWDMYSLLNLLYYKIYGVLRQIIHAPDKMCLKKFGGNLEIDEFRMRTMIEEKSYSIKFPPCAAVIPVMEEINLKKLQMNKPFIPIDKTRINKANNELRLKRNNPIHNAQNTLDKCMNITNLS